MGHILMGSHDSERAPDAARAVADADAALRSNDRYGGSDSSSATVAPDDANNGGAQNNGAASTTDPSNSKKHDPAAPAAGDEAPEESRTRLQTILIMFALCSALFLAALDVTIVATAVPTIVAEFGSASGKISLLIYINPSCASK